MTQKGLLQNPSSEKLYASIDEAGRGAWSGPVVAACVVWKEGDMDHLLADSKKLSEKKRDQLVDYIKDNAIDYAISFVDNRVIDEINILRATHKAMHECVAKLYVEVDEILVDGNSFPKYGGIHHQCVVKGDDTYVSIAAASILAKTARDEYMREIANKYPHYKWDTNFGYGTKDHMNAMQIHGVCEYHRMSYGPCKTISI